MGYSARRGFTNGSMKMTGAQRQAEMQARIQQMQEQVNAAQEAVEAQEFTASVGGGVVEAKVNGKKEVLAVTIKPEAVDPEDVEMLQDLVVSAVNEALRQAGEAMDKSIEQGAEHPACQQAERNVESCGVGRAGENSRAGNARRRACQPD